MAYLDSDTMLSKTFTLTQQSDTVLRLLTDGTYADKDIVLTLNAQSATPSFDGGAISGTATASGSSCSISDSTNNSGISITAAASASRAAVLYNGAVNGWVSKSDNDNALAASNSTSLTSTTYYINGVTLTAPASGTRSFTITVPNGSDSPITFTFTVDSSGEVIIT